MLTGAPAVTVRTPPAHPTLVWDGKCGFCKLWVDYWRNMTGEAIVYRPYQEVAHEYPEIQEEQFAKAVYYIGTDGVVWRGAGAVFAALRHTRGRRWLFWLYRRFPGFALLTEAAYAAIASHRSLGYRVMRLLGAVPHDRK